MASLADLTDIKRYICIIIMLVVQLQCKTENHTYESEVSHKGNVKLTIKSKKN